MRAALAGPPARVHDSAMRTLLAALLAAAPLAARAEPAAPPSAPPTFLQVLPAAVSLVAWLPVEGERDEVVLDLRVEAVLPRGCGDKFAGLIRRAGPSVEGPDAWDVVLERPPIGECKKDPVRVGSRWPVRMKLPQGATRSITLGERTLQVARAGDKVTLDGEPPAGDLPGAPPTGAPATLVLGQVEEAKVTGSHKLDPDTRAVFLHASVRWPKCAGAQMGWLGRGDAGSHFRVTHFEPLARAPIESGCRARVLRETDLQLSFRGSGPELTVGKVALRIEAEAPAAVRK